MTDHTAVVIGRFSPVHRGHLRLITAALGLASRVVIVIGSAFHARTPKNPFTWEERAEMIGLCLAAADRARVSFVPVRDYFDDERWATAVRNVVQAGAAGSTVLVGHDKDRSTRYLDWFPQWGQQLVASGDGIDATTLRKVFFAKEAPRSWSDRLMGRGSLPEIDARLAVLRPYMPAPALEYLRSWAALPDYAGLVAEEAQLQEYRAAWSRAPYPPIFTTADALVECGDHVLLVRRGDHPGKGLMALPGGFVSQHERLLDAAIRELDEETRMGLLPEMLREALRGVKVFDHPDRSLRGRTITHVHHFALGLSRLPQVRGSDDAAEAVWVPVRSLASLESQFFEDHFHILDEFLKLT